MTKPTGPTSLPARLVALPLRPLLIFFGSTQVAHLLLRLGGGPGLDSYPRWLAGVLPLRPGVVDALAPTLQLVLGGLAVGAVIAGAAAAVVAKSSRRRRPVGWWWFMLLALAGAPAAAGARYWADNRFDLPVTAAPSLNSDPAAAVERLIVPALVVGVTLAPALAALAGGALTYATGQYRQAVAMTAAAAPLAERAESRARWRLGFPAVSLLSAIVITETVFARPGVTAVLVGSLERRDPTGVLDLVAVVAMAFAALALVVDLVGLRPDRPLVPLAAGRQLRAAAAPWSRPALVVGAAFSGLVVAAAVAGSLIDPTAPEGESTAEAAVATALAGTAPTLMVALTPGAIAIVIGLGLLSLAGRLGGVGELLPSTIIDAAWWPAPLMALVAATTVDTGAFGVAHPAVLALVAVALTPTALRLLRREGVELDNGGLLRLTGCWLLTGSLALAVHTAAAVAGHGLVDSTTRPALGAQLGAALPQLGADTAAAVAAVGAPSLALIVIGAALQILGASLLQIGWHRGATASFDTVTDDDKAIDIDLTVRSQLSAAEALAAEMNEPDDHDQPNEHDQPDQHDEPEQADGSGEQDEREGHVEVAPNFDLQPGLPVPATPTRRTRPGVA